MSNHSFSDNYASARSRFQSATRALSAQPQSHPVGETKEDTTGLSIDVACIGQDDWPTVLITSGVHGVEGFFGSAVQLAQLQRMRGQTPSNRVRYVFIHAINPFGFAHLRRFNEDNIDLNRNCPTTDNTFSGSPAGYALLDDLINPKSAPSRIEPFALKALWQIARQGLQPLKDSIAGGQYEFPRGLFYGGNQPSRSIQILQQQLSHWLGSSPAVVHLDLHTGLGPFAKYKLLLSRSEEQQNADWYCNEFGAQHIEGHSASTKTAYPITGELTQWLHAMCADRCYRGVVAEFGTYGVIRMLAALRAENRAHHFATANSANWKRAKQELLECFSPAATTWRTEVMQSALGLIDQASCAATRLA